MLHVVTWESKTDTRRWKFVKHFCKYEIYNGIISGAVFDNKLANRVWKQINVFVSKLGDCFGFHKAGVSTEVFEAGEQHDKTS